MGKWCKGMSKDIKCWWWEGTRIGISYGGQREGVSNSRTFCNFRHVLLGEKKNLTVTDLKKKHEKGALFDSTRKKKRAWKGRESMVTS